MAEKLDVQGPGAVSVLKGHALRLHIDIGHLAEPPEGRRRVRTPDTAHLRKAGPLLAAAWFTLCGEDVSWPLEPCRYDLLVSGADGIRRIQVKTTTVRAGDSWKAYLSTTRGQRRPYDPDEIDEFFVIDPDMTYYLIPVASVGGLHAIHLSAYQEHRLPHLGS
ncbi:hypothetical protein B5M43_007550 [Microbacterium sp. MEC084]|uniref:group I intron-associated PD-(D/E)XK endonuclease n=1 Tax=unclassified Microbacterium TaxID=2609290 RepID=UPI0006F2EC16|nr:MULTISPECIES: group I intron-associated PD-(D/E)XK endonuclease [unclassified Microbacterium]KQY98695.1 hypothetical protein ASD19_05575 [Microbacterium sp. Root53]MCD1268702.1 hypothetical protein [Microbacterium sp. MEC084]